MTREMLRSASDKVLRLLREADELDLIDNRVIYERELRKDKTWPSGQTRCVIPL
jgi:hypothetical protein